MLVNAQSRVSLVTVIIWLWVSVAAIGGLAKSLSASDEHGTLRVLALGDSLTAGYGLGPGDGFVPQLDDWLNAASDTHITVTNGGVSGDTSAGGRARLDWALAPFGDIGPDLVIVELGANDGLRGIDPQLTRANLDAILAALTDKGVKILIAGMLAPPNLGAAYAADFNPIFADLAESYGAFFYPFFLDGVAADPALNQPDGIHPTAEGVSIIVDKLGPVVLAALQHE